MLTLIDLQNLTIGAKGNETVIKRRTFPRHIGLNWRLYGVLAAFIVFLAAIWAVQQAYFIGLNINKKQIVTESSVPEPQTPAEPGFDVIRVTRDGRAVMAGRAAPGAEVVLKSGQVILGNITADRRGDWVMILETPLPPGSQVLTLTTRLGENGPTISKESAIISVPDRLGGEVFVAVSREGKATRILEQGDPSATKGVALAGVDMAESGGSILSGRAAPGQQVRLYLDNEPIGEVITDPKGDWELNLSQKIAPGSHVLRADQLDEGGQVSLRAEVAFTRAETGSLTMGERQVVVQQGNALWEIARNIYGAGVAYSVIFTGNKGQIRDPDLIYPGQIFQIPDPAPGEAETSPGD